MLVAHQSGMHPASGRSAIGKGYPESQFKNPDKVKEVIDNQALLGEQFHSGRKPGQFYR